MTPGQFHGRVVSLRDAVAQLLTESLDDGPKTIAWTIATAWLGAVLQLLETQVSAGVPDDDDPQAMTVHS